MAAVPWSVSSISAAGEYSILKRSGCQESLCAPPGGPEDGAPAGA